MGQREYTLFKLFSNQLYGILKKSNSDKEAKKRKIWTVRKIYFSERVTPR